MKVMNKVQLFFLLHKNAKLSEKRHPMFEANQYGKLFAYIMYAFLVIYFIGLGTFFGWIAATEGSPEMIFFVMLFLLIFDFGGRFVAQQTPLMLVKPYLLTPISKYTAIDCFLISQILDRGNLIWMTFFLPYAFVVWCGGASTWSTLGMLFVLHLMVVVNSQWYLLVRSLIYRSLLWWLLPIAVYAAVIVPLVFSSNPVGQLQAIADTFYETPMLGLLALLLLAFLAVMFFVNRGLQFRFIHNMTVNMCGDNHSDLFKK